MGELPLSRLRDLESAVIERIEIQGRIKRRLVEMGITPGTRVEITKRAPLGDPIEISLRGYELTIRAEDADGIWVSRAGGKGQ